MLTTVFLTIALMIVATACKSGGDNKADTKGLLEGKTFTAEIKESGKDGETTPDEIIFTDGTFHSADCDQHGFEPSSYEAREDDGMILFTSTSTSAAEGKIDWKGMVTGNSIKGIFIWQKEGQNPITYQFSGKLKE